MRGRTNISGNGNTVLNGELIELEVAEGKEVTANSFVSYHYEKQFTKSTISSDVYPINIVKRDEDFSVVVYVLNNNAICSIFDNAGVIRDSILGNFLSACWVSGKLIVSRYYPNEYNIKISIFSVNNFSFVPEQEETIDSASLNGEIFGYVAELSSDKFALICGGNTGEFEKDLTYFVYNYDGETLQNESNGTINMPELTYEDDARYHYYGQRYYGNASNVFIGFKENFAFAILYTYIKGSVTESVSETRYYMFLLKYENGQLLYQDYKRMGINFMDGTNKYTSGHPIQKFNRDYFIIAERFVTSANGSQETGYVCMTESGGRFLQLSTINISSYFVNLRDMSQCYFQDENTAYFTASKIVDNEFLYLYAMRAVFSNGAIINEPEVSEVDTGIKFSEGGSSISVIGLLLGNANIYTYLFDKCKKKTQFKFVDPDIIWGVKTNYVENYNGNGSLGFAKTGGQGGDKVIICTPKILGG